MIRTGGALAVAAAALLFASLAYGDHAVSLSDLVAVLTQPAGTNPRRAIGRNGSTAGPENSAPADR